MEFAFNERKRWLFLGLQFTFTVYHIGEDTLTIDRGIFNKTEDDCYMYKIQDVNHSASLIERMMGLGTVTCFTADVTDRKLVLKHIRHSKDVKNYIFEKSEAARIKRRTLNMQNISADPLQVEFGNDGLDSAIFE